MVAVAKRFFADAPQVLFGAINEVESANREYRVVVRPLFASSRPGSEIMVID